MTGFGRGEASSGGFQVTVEVKTLNSRYLDISVRMPQAIQQKELLLKELVQARLSRGKAGVNIYVDKASADQPEVTFNGDKVRSYGLLLNQIRKEANITEPVRFADIFHFDDIFERRKENEEDVQVIWNCTSEALKQALDDLNEMRQKEGAELKADLANQITGISEMLDIVTDLSEKRAPEVRGKLRTRIRKMVDDDIVDPDRMELEIALLVDKMDINEEVIRLQSHLKFFLEALEENEPVGRRLNFLCQEINRELNTIGSKANDSAIAHHVVLGKEKLEQIREQVQNIE